MKTIDTKSLLLGILVTSLILALTSAKSVENSNLTFFSLTTSVGIYNQSTKTIYTYGINGGGTGLNETPSRIYQVADDGSNLIKK